MGTKSPGGPQRCRLILERCLAIQLCKPGHTPEDFWMYDSGYMIFQNFLAANAQCWWNAPLTAAARALKYAGHVAPGMLLVTAEPCALEVLRGAYARSVLKPPATYVISSVGDIDDCIVTPTVQGQFTPLPEALCDVIMDLTAQGHSATIENVRCKLSARFPHMTTPATEVIYDSLAQLMQERKIYQTSKGYFIVTPERRRSRSRPRTNAISNNNRTYQEYEEDEEQQVPQEARTILMTNSEAVHSLYGEISTERDGDLTHQCIQTNLADVICGGNPNDKIMYPRTSKRRSASFPTPRSLERRHSLRLFGSSKRLQRCASTRSLSKTYAQTLATDSSSSEYQSTDSSSPKKGSLLSRLFRRSGRTKQRQIETFSAQFPPVEWFNSRAVHLHSIGTQTNDHDLPVSHTLSNSTFYDGSELSQRSSTLPRRHRRHMSSESTFVISSRDCSPIRRRSPGYCSSSLPRSTQSIPASSTGTAQSIISANSRLSHPSHNNNKNHNNNNNNNNIHNNTNNQQYHHHHIIHHHPSHLQMKTPNKTILGKHLFEEQNRLATTTTTSSTNSNGTIKLLDNNKIVHYRNAQSGPSSLESGKASSSIYTSGPSSIDSGKLSFSKTSGHSSLESQMSCNTTMQQQSPTRSILILNGSPRSSPRHQQLKTKTASSSTTSTTTTTNSSNDSQQLYQQQKTGQKPLIPIKSSSKLDDIPHLTSKPPSGLPNSNSNSSITLQVTTSNGNQSNLPSTKIYVQNSPVRSVITLENGKLMENSNVFIINNETTTNEKGELIKKTLSKQQSQPIRSTTTTTTTTTILNPLKKDQNCSMSENDGNSETCDSISFISENSPDLNDVLSSNELIDSLKFTKNTNNDVTMNNIRKLSLQIPQNCSNNIVFKNCLKNDSNPNTPIDKKLLSDFDVTGSVGNLRYYEKTSNDSQNCKLNSNCDLKNLRYESVGNLNSIKSAINTDSLVDILKKNIITVGSEPNLAIKNSDQRIKSNNTTNINCIDKTFNQKENFDRRFSLSKETTAEDLYNFPSLTDLSFNFTSLAAQKILQGVSLNSIDTLVELNLANNKEKQQNLNKPPAVCTDYGMV